MDCLVVHVKKLWRFYEFIEKTMLCGQKKAPAVSGGNLNPIHIQKITYGGNVTLLFQWSLEK